MSWVALLYKTYNNLDKLDYDEKRGLLPIGHSTQKAHVEITLDINGNFKRADFVADVIGKEKNLSETLIPVTEKSASRSSGSAPHPLCDKLKYIASDYFLYVGEKNEVYYNDYIKALEQWANSQYATPKVKAVYEYVKKGRIIKDLIEADIFSVSQSGKLSDKWEKCNIKLTVGNQAEAFIRFRVIGNGDVSEIWQDRFLQEQYIKYYSQNATDKNICYVAGAILPISQNHPSKIRNSGDKAKLISANDSSGFTYRGRFENDGEAVNISYEVSQKAHNALKYLIQKQGERVGEKVFLLWGTKNEETPSLNVDSEDIFGGGNFEDLSEYSDLRAECAEKFNRAISGYGKEVHFDTQYAMIGLDAATVGRLSIIYYREYKGIEINDLLERINTWHKTASWLHSYKFKDKKRKIFYGAPSPYDIALCTFGTEREKAIQGNNQIIANTFERLLPCITDGAKIPRDIVRTLVNKCYAPEKYDNYYNWLKVLTITCSVYKKYLYDYESEVVDMEIDKKSTDISYNCGRLLAVADEIERYAQYSKGSETTHTTNAMRYYNRFSRVPCNTWGIIKNKLVPYVNSLGKKGNYLIGLMEEISANIDVLEFEQARNLDGKMALGFDTQKQEIHNKIFKSNQADTKEEEE